MNLYEISQQILDLVDKETGEIADLEQFEQLEMARDTKIENIACWIKNLNCDIEDLRDEEKMLKKRREAKERKVESLRRYLTHFLNGNNFETARVAIAYRSSTSLDVLDGLGLVTWLEVGGYDDCLRYAKPTVNKDAVKQLLSDGVAVPCVQIVKKQNMRIK